MLSCISLETIRRTQSDHKYSISSWLKQYHHIWQTDLSKAEHGGEDETPKASHIKMWHVACETSRLTVQRPMQRQRVQDKCKQPEEVLF